MKKNTCNLLIVTLVIALFGCSNATVIVNDGTSNYESMIVEQSNNEAKVQLTELLLDQDDSFIALSSSDATGFDRWIPFYFSLQTELDYSAEEIEASLVENISEITLYNEKNIAILTTDELIWTPFKLAEHQYNLTLVIQADLDITIFNEITKLHKLVLKIDGKPVAYTLSNYLIEARETFAKDFFEVTVSTMETTLSEDLYAPVNYGIMDKKRNGIKKVDLDFPKDFATITKYELEARPKKEEDILEYSAYLYFSSLNKKIVFRPFIRVHSNNGTEGWLIPTVPAYIK